MITLVPIYLFRRMKVELHAANTYILNGPSVKHYVVQVDSKGIGAEKCSFCCIEFNSGLIPNEKQC